MSTLTETAAACCACIRVRWVETRHPTGEVSGRWVCSSCQREFVPAAQLEQVRAEAREEQREVCARSWNVAGLGIEDAIRAAFLDKTPLADRIAGLNRDRAYLREDNAKYRADFVRDQAEIASLRIDVADLRNQRDQCHLRAQTAELANEELQRRIENLETRAVSEATLAARTLIESMLSERGEDHYITERGHFTDQFDREAREALALLDAEAKS